MKIYIGGDHAGYQLKEKIKPWLEKQGHEIVDCGPFKIDNNDDYPDFVIPLAKQVSKDKGSMGISLAASGQGEGIAMNRVKGIRAAVYYGKNMNIIKLSREHNNSNILSIGARFVSDSEAKKAINLWLKTKFDPDSRHERRLKKIEGGK